MLTELTLRGRDHAALDRAIRTVIQALPERERAGVTIQVQSRDGNVQRRALQLPDISEDAIKVLTRVDLPHDVGISVRFPNR